LRMPRLQMQVSRAKKCRPRVLSTTPVGPSFGIS
jgi:hypothetical protein